MASPADASNRWLLIPTRREQELLARAGVGFGDWRVLICGFGPIAAAASTARLLATEKPAQVVLAGIAGSLNEQEFPPGAARWFNHFIVEGVGVGHAGDYYLSPREMDLPQFVAENGKKIFDEIDLSSEAENRSTLLTACAASANEAHANMRRSQFPDAIAEDMEAFAVALACVQADVRLSVVRGCSNVTGDRNKANWRFQAAATAIARELNEL